MEAVLLSNRGRYTPGAGPTLLRKRNKGDQATLDTAGVLIGKLLQPMDGGKALHESMEAIMGHPERVGGVCIVLANLVARMSDRYYPGGLQAITDYFVEQVAE